MPNGDVYDGVWNSGKPEEQQSNAADVEQTPDSKSSVKKKSEPRPIGAGSGFAVSGSHIVTNAHVVDGCDIITGFKLGLKPFPLQVLHVDSKNDIAVLVSRKKLSDSFSFAKGRVTLSEDVFVAGFPANITLSEREWVNFEVKVTKGIVSSHSGINQNPNTFFVDAAINPGNSGGPLTNASGEVVGVATARARGTTNNGFIAVKTHVVESHLLALGVNPMRGKNKTSIASIRQGIFSKAVYLLHCWEK